MIEGAVWDIPAPWSLGRKYGHHPIAAFQGVREISMFDHVSDIELSALIAMEVKYTPRIYGYSWVSNPDRVDFYSLVERIAKDRGAICVNCGPGTPTPRIYGHRLVNDYKAAFVCDNCILAEKRRANTAALRRCAKERRVSLRNRKIEQLLSIHRAELKAQKEARDKSYKDKRDAERAAAEHQRLREKQILLAWEIQEQQLNNGEIHV